MNTEIGKPNHRVAIDIGSSKVSVLVAEMRGEGANSRPNVVAFASVPHREDEADSLGRVQALQIAITEAEKQANIKIERAYVNLPDKKLRAFRKRDTVFTGTDMKTITGTELGLAIAEASKVDVGASEHVLHIIPHTYFLDEDHAVKNPLGMHSSELAIESQIIAASDASVTEMREILRKCNIVADKVIVSQLAVAESTLTAEEMDDGVAIVDIGHAGTGLAMFYEGRLVHVDALPVGGRNVTRDLVVSLAISYEDAESIKLQHGSCNVSLQKLGDEIEVQPQGLEESVSIGKKDIADIVKARYREICQLMMHKMNDHATPETPISRLVFSGGASKMVEFGTLARHVSQHLVRLGTPTDAIGRSDDLLSPENAVTIGMILWANQHVQGSTKHTRPAGTRGDDGDGGRFMGKFFGKFKGVSLDEII